MATNTPAKQKSPSPNKSPAPAKKAPSTKARTSKAGFKQEWRDLLQAWERQMWAWLRTIEKFRYMEENNYELGHHHLQLGNFSDAIFRFRFVLRLNPKRADAWYWLGCAHMAKHNREIAKKAFKMALVRKPGYEEASFMLTLLGCEPTPDNPLPKRMPFALAREYFDNLAPTYTQDQLATQKYTGHTVLCNAVRSQLVPGEIDHVLLELGVGTGLCGPLLRDIAGHITGVDISERMLAEAQKVQDRRGGIVYDSLLNRDLQGFLSEAPAGGYDVVYAGLALTYVGDLEEIFTDVARTLKSGGIFAFTVDKQNEEGYHFSVNSVRFRYSHNYLEGLAKANGLAVVKCTYTDIYKDYSVWLCVFKK